MAQIKETGVSWEWGAHTEPRRKTSNSVKMVLRTSTNKLAEAQVSMKAMEHSAINGMTNLQCVNDS